MFLETSSWLAQMFTGQGGTRYRELRLLCTEINTVSSNACRERYSRVFQTNQTDLTVEVALLGPIPYDRVSSSGNQLPDRCQRLRYL